MSIVQHGERSTGSVEVSPARSFQPDLQDKALRWLAYGCGLARSFKGEHAKHADVIWCLLADAVDVIDRLPDQERSWLTSGTRGVKWHLASMSFADLLEIERIRVLSSIKPYDGETKTSPQRDDIDRSLGVLEWMRWLNAARLPKRLSKAALTLLRKGDSIAVQKIYCPNRKPDRRNIAEIKIRTIGYILAGLHRDLRIAQGSGITFVDERQAHADDNR